MNNIIIKKEEKNIYKIKVYEYIDIYNIDTLKKLIKIVLKKIKKKNNLRKQIIIDIYPSKFETIIILKDYNKLINSLITEVKINIHTDTIFLHEINYLTIKNTLKGIIYYYKNKFYLRVKEIDKDNFLYLSEHSNLIYENTNKIIENGLKIKI